MNERRQRALVIDDDPKVRDLLGELLSVLGYEVECVADGAEGLALFEAGKYALLVTDLMLPGMWGWEIAGRVRQDDAEIGIVLATGSASNLDTACRNDLRVVVLSKPFSFGEFRVAVHRALTLEAGVPTGGTRGREGERAGSVPEESGMPPELSSDWLAQLRTAIATARTLADHLAGVAGHAEHIVREHDGLQARLTSVESQHRVLRQAHDELIDTHERTVAALTQLQGEHDATVRALVDSREECQTLSRMRRQTIEDLETVLQRLRPSV